MKLKSIWLLSFINYCSCYEARALRTPVELPPQSQKKIDNFLSWNTPLVHIQLRLIIKNAFVIFGIAFTNYQFLTLEGLAFWNKLNTNIKFRFNMLQGESRGRSNILMKEYIQFSKKYFKQSKSISYKINDPDPVQTLLFVNNMNHSTNLPSLYKANKKIKRGQKANNLKTQGDRTRSGKYQFSLNTKRYIHSSFDVECNSQFPRGLDDRNKKIGMEKKRQKFIEVDILSLETNYAKNIAIFTDLKNAQGQKKHRKMIKVPAKEDVSDFIRTYKVQNEQINVENLVRRAKFGVQFKQDNYLYFGELKDDQMDGQGIMVTKTWIFEGEWIKSKKVRGVQISNKGIYKGKYINNERSKVGEYFWYNGEYYSGEWLKNQKHGKGVWKSPKGDIYMGQWHKGNVQGVGTHLCKSGQKYEGHFLNFLKHGKGKQYFPNGDYFQGQFKEGKPDGFGNYQWKTGIEYQGNFKQGFRDGKGTISKLDMSYAGTFEKQKAHGSGKLQIGNGENYVGEFRRGKKEGKGIYRSKKQIYLGNWINNKFIINS